MPTTYYLLHGAGMSSLGLYTKEQRPASTDWDDIQRRLGNLPPLPDDDARRPRDQAAIEAGADSAPAADAPPAIEDEEDELEQLRARRLRELKERARFGEVIQIDRAAFVPQVRIPQSDAHASAGRLLCPRGQPRAAPSRRASIECVPCGCR